MSSAPFKTPAFDENTVPTELWTQVFLEVASADRTDLRPVLLVSHRIREILLPLFYEKIAIGRVRPHELFTGTRVSTVDPVTSLRNLSSSPHLVFTKDLTLDLWHDSNFIMDVDELTSKMVSSMPNLKKLSLKMYSADTLLKSMNMCSAGCSLTHLSIPGYVSAEPLCEFLIAHPSLQYLYIDTVLFSNLKLPRYALPHLHTFIGDSRQWDHFVRGRRIEHLSGHLVYELPAIHYHEVFGAVRTLDLWNFPRARNLNIMPFLRSIEYLRIRNSGNIDAESICGIPSTKLRYLSLISPDIDNMVLFNAFPRLDIIDQMDRSTPVAVRIPPKSRWEPWWACVDQWE
ncbi:hypothetical protein ONZ45_g7185 [Pleurotus djamor]|nr:hypothetical protein ONZ45_g7185 [Pleurotus djamor]